MRRIALLALILSMLAAGCGDDTEVPDLGLAEAEEAYECLDGEGFEVSGTRTPNDSDGADVELAVRSGEVPIAVAYYESPAEAQRRERDLVASVAAAEGTVLIRDAVAIVTGGVPDADDKAAVEGCVF